MQTINAPTVIATTPLESEPIVALVTCESTSLIHLLHVPVPVPPHGSPSCKMSSPLARASHISTMRMRNYTEPSTMQHLLKLFK